MSSPYREADPPTNDPPCPRCQGALAPIREKRLVGRRCTWCKGIWLEREVFDEVLGHEQTRALLAEPQPVKWVDDGQTVRCTRCDDWMTRQVVWSKPSIIVDHCEHGIWLDRGEIEALVAAFPPGSVHPLQTEAPPAKRTSQASLLMGLAEILFWW